MSIEIKPGQVWTYDNRDTEPESRVVILQIDELEKRVVYHVCVLNLAIKNPSNANDPIDRITHMPFSKDAIERSLVTLEGQTEIPDFSEGYQYWKEGYETGDAGVFTASVGDAVGYMERTVNEPDE